MLTAEVLDFFREVAASLVSLYTTSTPGRGFGLQFGILGALSAIFSVLVYVARNRLDSLQFVGQKRHWLMLHMVTGLLGAFLVFVHATLAWSGIAGLANLAMWCAVVSGILARYFSVRVPRVQFQKKQSPGGLDNQLHTDWAFWSLVHIWSSLAFVILFLGIHVLVVLLFKPLYKF